MKKFIATLAIIASSTTFAAGPGSSTNGGNGPIFLNIPAHKDVGSGEYIPAMSIVTSNWDACADAIVSYAKDNYVNYIGCDRMPLRDAVNMRGYRR